MYKLLCMSRIASSPLLPTLRMNSIRGAYVPCSKRTCLIGSAGGERKMCPKRVILRLRHASESLTWLYLRCFSKCPDYLKVCPFLDPHAWAVLVGLV